MQTKLFLAGRKSSKTANQTNKQTQTLERELIPIPVWISDVSLTMLRSTSNPPQSIAEKRNLKIFLSIEILLEGG